MAMPKWLRDLAFGQNWIAWKLHDAEIHGSLDPADEGGDLSGIFQELAREWAETMYTMLVAAATGLPPSFIQRALKPVERVPLPDWLAQLGSVTVVEFYEGCWGIADETSVAFIGERAKVEVETEG